LLREAPPELETPPERLVALAEAAKRRQTKSFTHQDWLALLSDPDSLEATRP
jgi:hypothetical protein